MAEHRRYCLYLRTKTAYYRDESGLRMFDAASTTACYNCLRTQRPVGPDGAPADASACGEDRGCYEEDR